MQNDPFASWQALLQREKLEELKDSAPHLHSILMDDELQERLRMASKDPRKHHYRRFIQIMATTVAWMRIKLDENFQIPDGLISNAATVKAIIEKIPSDSECEVAAALECLHVVASHHKEAITQEESVFFGFARDALRTAISNNALFVHKGRQLDVKLAVDNSYALYIALRAQLIEHIINLMREHDHYNEIQRFKDMQEHALNNADAQSLQHELDELTAYKHSMHEKHIPELILNAEESGWSQTDFSSIVGELDVSSESDRIIVSAIKLLVETDEIEFKNITGFEATQQLLAACERFDKVVRSLNTSEFDFALSTRSRNLFWQQAKSELKSYRQPNRYQECSAQEMSAQVALKLLQTLSQYQYTRPSWFQRLVCALSETQKNLHNKKQQIVEKLSADIRIKLMASPSELVSNLTELEASLLLKQSAVLKSDKDNNPLLRGALGIRTNLVKTLETVRQQVIAIKTQELHQQARRPLSQ